MKLSSLFAYPVIIFVVLANLLAAQPADDANNAKLEQRDQLCEEAEQCVKEGKFDEAITLLEQVYTLEKSVFGAAHPELLGTLSWLGDVATLKQDDTAAIDLRKRQHRMSEQLYGQTDYQTQDASRAITDAEQNAIRSPEQRTSLREAWEAMSTVDKLIGEGQFILAIPMATKAAAIRKQVLGEQHPDYANSLNDMAYIYHNMGEYARAEPLYTQAIEIDKQVLGEQHPNYATSLKNLASLYQSTGEYNRSEPLYKQAMEIQKQALGEQHPEYVTSLNHLTDIYYNIGDYARAELLCTQALEIQKQLLGEQHLDYASSLYSLAQVYAKLGDFGRAEPMFTQAIEIQKQLLGEQHPDYATSLSSLAFHYYSKGDYARALPLFSQAMEIRRQVLGELHPNYANSLNSLAQVYANLGDYGRAVPLFTRAIEIQKQVLGEQHPNYATSLNNLAILYSKMGDYGRAEPLYTRVMESRRQVLGELHPDYATALNNLGSHYSEVGDYGRAEPLLTQAIEIQKQVLGEQHPEYANSVNSLAHLYSSMGDYGRAEPLCKQAMEIRRQVLGEQHPEYAGSLNNLGMIYSAMGDYGRAEPLCKQAIEIQKHVHGELHPDYATSLNNLAHLYSLMDFMDSRAEPLYTRAMEIRRQVLGEQHPDYAGSLSNLAHLYSSIGAYGPAEALYKKAMEIEKQVLGEQHPDYARSLNNLGMTYSAMGDYERAEPLLRRAIEIRKRVLGEKHPDYSSNLINLAAVYGSMGDYARAEPLYTEAIGNSLRHLNETASVLTEQQQIAMSRSLRHQLDNSVGCALQMNPQPQAIAEQLVAWKGAVLVRLRALRLAADDPAIADAFKQLQSKTQQLSALTGAVPEPDKLDAWRAQITELTSQKDKLDAELMRNSDAFRAAQKKVSLSDVRQAIPTDGVIVDYLDYFRYGKQGRSLMATVVRRNGKPLMVDLGSAEDAGDAISRWRDSLGASDVAREAGQQLRRQIWEPLLTHIGDAKLVFVSTDGVLGQMPLAALPGKAAGSYLIEDHAIVMLPVPILLPRLMERQVGESKLLASSATGDRQDRVMGLLMGDVDYDAVAAPSTPTPVPKLPGSLLMASNTIQRTRGGLTWGPLTETRKEIDSIATLLGGNVVQLRKREALRQAQLWLLKNPDAIEGRDLRTRGEVRIVPINPVDTNVATDKPTRSLPAYWAAFQLSGDPR